MVLMEKTCAFYFNESGSLFLINIMEGETTDADS